MLLPQITAPAQDFGSLWERLTVRVRTGNGATGSGVLIGHQGSTYFVLTARHVVNSRQVYYIDTYDGLSWPVGNYSTAVRRDDNADLALIAFISNANYVTASVGDSSSEHLPLGAQVSICGFPFTAQVQKCLPGNIVGRAQPANLGYGLYYDILAVSGMGGGPIFDRNGFLVGIHGQNSLTSKPRSDTSQNFSMGVPIETALATVLRSQPVDLTPLPPKPINSREPARANCPYPHPYTGECQY